MRPSVVALQPPGALPENLVISEPPFCTLSNVSIPRATLPKYVFVAGIEGSGHHALKSVWEAMQKNIRVGIIEFDQVLHSFGIENHASYHYSSVRLGVHQKNMQDKLDAINANSLDLVIDCENSYPMGMGAGSLAHPDMLMMKALDGVIFDLRIIVLQRNPTKSVMSAVRRFKKDDRRYSFKSAGFQARTVAESIVHINNVIPHLPCGKFMVLKYEDFVAEPQKFAAPLSKLLDVPLSAFDGAFDQIKPSSHSSNISPETQKDTDLVSQFFSIQHKMWPLFASDYYN